MTIVYESVSGFTEEYARILAGQTGLPLLTRAQAEKTLEQGSSVLYLGWLCAGRISGLGKLMKHCQVEAACGVGLAPPGEQVSKDLARKNRLPHGPVFYLHGGYAPQRLTGGHKLIMAAVTKSMSKKIASKPQLDAEDTNMLTALRQGGSFVSPGQLRHVLDWLDRFSHSAE